MKRTLTKEEARMKKFVSRAILLATAVPTVTVVAFSCSSSSSVAPLDAGRDSTADTSAHDASIIDATSDDPCAPTFVYGLDGGPLPDGAVECSNYQHYACGLPDGQAAQLRNSCYFSLDDCNSLCPGIVFSCLAYGPWCSDGGVIPDAGRVIVECVACANGVGRRPAGMIAARISRGKNRVGEYFASAAHLEAASIRAFRVLTGELANFGAPDDLIAGADRARRDEVKHARITSRIARQNGSKPPRARATSNRARTLEDVAIENAVEGCVRETFGAMVCAHQAAHAKDRDIARAMTTIAEDETRHAALAWATATWAKTKLDRAAQERIARVAQDAIDGLEAETAREPHEELLTRAGLPSSSVQRAMLTQLRAEIRSMSGAAS